MLAENSKKNLVSLLNTPSPSGGEVKIQKMWMKLVKKYSDKLETDLSGNAISILNPDADFKILLAAHCDEIGFVINRIDDNGYLYFSKVGGISHKIAPGLKVEVLGYKKKSIIGIVGANAEHLGGLKDKFEYEDLFIDIGAKNKKEAEKIVRIADYAVYKREPEFLLNNRISGKALDNKSGVFILAEVMKKLHKVKDKLKVGVYSVSTVNEETNMTGAYFAASGIKPNIAIACDVTFATDHPGVNTSKYGEFKLDKGPVLANGAPVNKKINKIIEKSAKKLKIDLQYELTPAFTGTDADKMRVTGNGVPVALISLPLRYMHSPVETVSLKDVEDEINLIVEMVLSLTGEENLKPLE